MSYITTTTAAGSLVVPTVHIAADSQRQEIATVLGVDPSLGWKVLTVESFETKAGAKVLAIVDVDPMQEPSLVYLRGIIVSLTDKIIVATSQGYTDSAVADTLMPDGGDLSLVDTVGKFHHFVEGKYVAHYGLDGVIVRLFWYGGVMFVATHRNVWLASKPKKSRWGSGTTFHEMLDLCGVPKTEQLFDTSKDNSSTCHVFLLCHPNVNNCTRISGTFCSHVESFTMDMGTLPDVVPGLLNFETFTQLNAVVEKPGVYAPQSLSVDEINEHLHSGFFGPVNCVDPRVSTGESVMLFAYDNGTLKDVVRVYSTAAYHRFRLRGSDNNVVHRFYCLITEAMESMSNDAACIKFWSQFASVAPYSPEQVRETIKTWGGINYIPVVQLSPDWLDLLDNRIHLIWLNILLAVAPEHQMAFADAFENFLNDRQQLVQWLVELERDKSTPLDQRDKEYSRCKGLIGGARKAAVTLHAKRPKTPLTDITASLIQTYVLKEKGASLYKLVRLMKESNK